MLENSILVKVKYSKLYLAACLWLPALLLPTSIIATFFNFREILTISMFFIFFFLDLTLIMVYFKSIKLTKLELILIFIILISIPIGLINIKNFDRRLVTDLTNPLFFVLKCSIFRRIFTSDSIKLYLPDYIQKLIKISFLFGVLTIALFYFLVRIKPMYAGMTPIVHPYFIKSLLNGSWIGQFLSIIIALLSGKRALLLSTLVIFIVFKVYVKRHVFKIFSYALVFVGIILGALWINIQSPIAAVDKYVWSFEQIKDIEVDISLKDETGILNLVSGGRIGEIQGALKEMNTFDFLFGKGIGFTYTVYSNSLETDIVGYSNLHFSPLSIITKYGTVFLLMFLIYVFYNLYGFRDKGFIAILFGLYLVGYLTDMLFAYIIFVDPLIPIALGYLSFNKYPNTGKRVEKF
jgi:hypothetical protein